MVCDWIGTLVDNLVGCMETDEDGDEGEAVLAGATDGVHEVITDNGEDGLTVPVWI